MYDRIATLAPARGTGGRMPRGLGGSGARGLGARADSDNVAAVDQQKDYFNQK